MKTQNRLATDDNGFMVLAIVLIVMAIIVIVLLYFFPFLTLGGLMVVGALFWLFQGTVEAKYPIILMIAGVCFAIYGIFTMGGFGI